MKFRRAGVIILSAFVLASCGSRVRDDVWNDLAAEGGAPTATTLPRDEDNRGTGGVTGTATTLASRRANGASRQSTSGSQDAAGPLPAPANGTYTYDESGVGAKSTTTEQWTAVRGADSVTLTSVEKRTLGDDSVTVTSKYRVTKSAFELTSTTSNYNDEEPETCTYKPPPLVLPLPLKVGAKWKTSGTCAGDEESDEDSISFEVTGTATDTIGGQSVKTFTIKGTQSFDSTDDTTGERTTYTFTDTRHVDPTTLLAVIEDITFNFDGDSQTIHKQLRSLTPTA